LKLIAKTFHGTEDILIEELKTLGVENITKLRRAVSFDANKEQLYRANLSLRTALRILCPFHHFNAYDENDLYKKVYAFNWESIFRNDQTFAIDATVFSEQFTHSKFLAQKVKDAIVDQFRTKTGKRPDVALVNPDIRINVHVDKNRFSISTDSSGDSLHKRGYRPEGAWAPLNEALAASMILMSKWDGRQLFIDPMCGSGTLALEAAMIATNTPPGFYRKKFGFMGWKNFDSELWKKVHDEARFGIKECEAEIWASDASSGAINMSKEAARKFDLSGTIRYRNVPFEQFTPPSANGLLIINPPYGERMQDQDTDLLYQEIGDQLKKHFQGFSAWIISSNFESMKKIGLKPSSKHTLFNGSLECKYYHYELYAGSKKVHKKEDAQK
jgi:putative N6-adenine-specific DNA methylase